MNICEHLTATARIFPERTAIVFEGEAFSYSHLDRQSAAIARKLEEAGVRRGDRVALMLPNVPAFVVWYYAALRLGAIVVSVSTRSAAAEVAFLVEDSAARVLVIAEEPATAVPDQLPACVSATFVTGDRGDTANGQPVKVAEPIRADGVATEPHDAALILYTSGTTGFAKGATLSHANVRSNVHAFNHLCNMQPTDRILLSVPLFHCFGQNALLNSALNVGATIILQRRFELNEAKRLIRDQQVTQLYGVPMMFQLFLDRCEPADLASVGYCFSAAAPLPLPVSQRWDEKFGLPINEGYGLTETSPFASYNHRHHFVPGSIGTPIDSVEMKIIDTETGSDCPPGELGEIAIRGPNVMLGYWNRESETRAAIRDGWFHSGDIGRVDDKGFFYIVDRVKDMITVGGLKVFPAEVERVLLDLPAVADAAVVGIANEVFGEQVVGFVVLRDDDSKRDPQALVRITQYAQAHLADYKVPRILIPLDELPRNPSGKVLKTKLREYDLPMPSEQIAAGGQQAEENSSEALPTHQSPLRPPSLKRRLQQAHEASRSQLALEFVQQLVQSIAARDGVPDPQARFLDVGLDSMGIVEMSNQIQIEVGEEHEVSATLVFDYPRICELADYLVVLLTESVADGPANQADVSPAEPNTREGLQDEIASLTEAEALAELMRELDG